MKINEADHIIITDIGSTTTKALLLSKKHPEESPRVPSGTPDIHPKGLQGTPSGTPDVHPAGSLRAPVGTPAETMLAYTLAAEHEVPTTVEKPYEDVKIGVINAVKGLEEKSRIKLLDSAGRISFPYITTSSAGGGLGMLVFGLSAVETGRVAQMTAYGAGGVILKTLTIDDHIPVVEKMRLIRELHPDLVLMAGGIDGGAISGVVNLAELLSLAEPEPKFRSSDRIPLVFCGNVDAQRFVLRVLEEHFEVHTVANIRPSMKDMNTEPAKRKVHELFMENVMERAPGYAALKSWVAADILPTPAGVASILGLYGRSTGENIAAADIGGATTDIFSNIMGAYHRTVAANIGVSYSLSNVLAQSGIGKILRHLPEEYSENEVRDYIANKTLNPTYVPRHDCERLVEQAAAAEGIAIAWDQHKEMNFKIARVGRLDRRKLRKDVDAFEELFFIQEDTYFQPKDIQRIIGAGGVLSHAKSKEEALWVLVEGFKPSGITKISLDKNFKSPHMGALSRLDPALALDLYSRQCLEDLAFVVAPLGNLSPRREVLTVKDNKGTSHTLKGGQALYLNDHGELTILLSKEASLAGGLKQVSLKTTLPVLFDCRGRGERMLDIPLSKSGIWNLFPAEGFKTDVRRGASEIATGTYTFERRLPYEGEIFVREGQSVTPDTAIGENRFGPPKLYIIDIYRFLGHETTLDEKEIEEGMLVKAGDQVQLGTHLFKTTKGNLLGIPYFISSPLRARISHIEKGGLIIMREIQDYDEKPHVVGVARALRIAPRHVSGYLKVREGDFVEKDQVIAQDLSQAAFVKAPSTGVLKKMDTREGTVTIQYDIKPVSLKSFVGGTVSHIRPAFSAHISGEGTILYGILGFGREAWGELAVLTKSTDIDFGLKGKIVVTAQPIDEEFLRKAAEIEVAGIVAPSVENADWVRFYGQEMGVALTGDEQIPFTLILTEGFGRFDMNDDYAKFLAGCQGRHASLSGRTQIRAGVTRPMVIVSR